VLSCRIDVASSFRKGFFRLLLLGALAAPVSAPADERPIPPEIVQLRVESADFSPSRRKLDVVLRAEIADGWHVNAHEPGIERMIGTTLAIEPPAGFDVGDVAYPPAENIVPGFAGGKPLSVYTGTLRFRVPLTVRGELTAEGSSFRAKLRYQACDETRCLRPADVERTFLVKSPGADAKTAASSTNATPVDQWLARHGLPLTLVLVALMGLGLNLTPCVYPLISVTLAYFGSQARERRGRVVLLSSLYALGIALTFSVLGVSAALSGALFGRALQHPATLVGVAVLMVVLAASNFGLYSLQPPARLLQRVGGASVGAGGALFMGLTMGIVAAPCVGPIVVGLLATVGAHGDPQLGFLLFFALAVGLGAPYVALGVAAGSIARLPRSGEWLRWIEHLFGFLLLGLALYFVSPLLPARVVPWAAAALLAAAGVVLAFLSGAGRGRRLFPLVQRTVGVLAIAAAAWVLSPASAERGAIPWQPFSAQALAEARAARKPSVVDFRADWCLPCLEMDRTTFVAPEVAAGASRFVMLQADVTEMSAAAEDLLSRYQVLGVPTTIFYDREGKERHRTVGYVGAEDFVKLLEETGGMGKTEEEARQGSRAAAPG
jgi:thiol:disulfide interchange protein DsbD